MGSHGRNLAYVLCFVFLASQTLAKENISAYFSNDSLNGLKFSDAYETHNMGLLYSKDDYYIKLDLGLVSPDMYVYRNRLREANRSFGEIISLEVGEPKNNVAGLRYYARVRTAGEFGLDKMQDFMHRLFSLQQVNEVNDLVRMPADTWFGVGFRNEFEPEIFELKNVELNLDGFVGSDTTFLTVKLTKEFKHPFFVYDLSAGGRIVAYDKVVSAPPMNGQERGIIPLISLGISYENGPYKVFVRDTFSLPSIKTDSSLFGVFSAGASYNF